MSKPTAIQIPEHRDPSSMAPATHHQGPELGKGSHISKERPRKEAHPTPNFPNPPHRPSHHSLRNPRAHRKTGHNEVQ